jgi:7-cyano-7-deazaguanine synthase in queuosine biosynthesis
VDYFDCPLRWISGYMSVILLSGGLDSLVMLASCYEGGDKPCGACSACVERKEAGA